MPKAAASGKRGARTTKRAKKDYINTTNLFSSNPSLRYAQDLHTPFFYQFTRIFTRWKAQSLLRHATLPSFISLPAQLQASLSYPSIVAGTAFRISTSYSQLFAEHIQNA
jgi:hypothetical protein